MPPLHCWKIPALAIRQIGYPKSTLGLGNNLMRLPTFKGVVTENDER